MINLIGGALHQWDIDRQMKILRKDIVGMIFDNNHCGNPIAVTVEDGLVTIPNELLQQNITISVYGITSENKIVYSCQLSVNSRQKPNNYSEPIGGTSWNDITDKPFGEEIAMETLLPETGLTGYDDISALTGVAFHFDKKYVVTFNGVRYECTPYKNIDGNWSIGDSRRKTYWDDNGDEQPDMSHPEDMPFNIEGLDPDSNRRSWWLIFGEWKSGEVATVKIEAEGGVEYRPLDENYIPNNIPKIRNAKVGQVLVVKSVDENGVPAAWECVDR